LYYQFIRLKTKTISMKKNLITALAFVAVSLVFTNCKKEETGSGEPEVEFLASLDVETKHAVLEDYTGVRCGFCPDGHLRAQALIDQYGDNVVVLGVNAGSYAAPSANWANFTTPYGQAFINLAQPSGYPNGSVNRVKYAPAATSGTSMGRGSWKSAAEAMMTENSPVNIGAKATFNSSTRELTVKVDAYYTADGNGANKLNIAFLQSGMVANQSGGGQNYVHKHVLRDLITGQWGDDIPAESTAMGSRYSKTYTYTVPADFNGPVIPPGGGEVFIQDCKLAIYIAEGQENIYTGINVTID
jgi:hypothetical protein